MRRWEWRANPVRSVGGCTDGVDVGHTHCCLGVSRWQQVLATPKGATGVGDAEGRGQVQVCQALLWCGAAVTAAATAAGAPPIHEPVWLLAMLLRHCGRQWHQVKLQALACSKLCQGLAYVQAGLLCRGGEAHRGATLAQHFQVLRVGRRAACGGWGGGAAAATVVALLLWLARGRKQDGRAGTTETIACANFRTAANLV